MYSSIPLIGLVHKIYVYRREDLDDGAGGVIPGGRKIDVYDKLCCRISFTNDQDTTRQFGNSSRESFLIISKYAPKISKSDFIKLCPSVFQKAPIEDGVEYRIISVKHPIDHNGGFHHTKMIVEREDID